MYVYLYYRHSSEPEFSLWKKNLYNTDGFIEPQLASMAGIVSDQLCETERSTTSSVPVTLHTNTCDVDSHLPPMMINKPASEQITTEATGASKSSCVMKDSVSVGLIGTEAGDAKSESVLEKQGTKVDHRTFTGSLELPAATDRSENTDQSLARSAGAGDIQNLSDMVPAPSVTGTLLPHDEVSSSNQPMVSSLLADSAAVSSASVMSSATSDITDPMCADDGSSSHQVVESLSSEIIQPSASEPQMVCDCLYCSSSELLLAQCRLHAPADVTVLCSDCQPIVLLHTV